MIEPIETTIFIEPVGKARARTVVGKNGKVHSFTPDKTAAAESMIRNELLKFNSFFVAGTPLRLFVKFYFSRPKSVSRKREFPVTRPDFDNCTKLLLDAMNKFVFADDSQIVTAIISKRYVKPGQVPRIELRLAEEAGE